MVRNQKITLLMADLSPKIGRMSIKGLHVIKKMDDKYPISQLEASIRPNIYSYIREGQLCQR